MATVTVGYDSSGNPGTYTSLALWWASLHATGGTLTEAETARLMNGTSAGRAPGAMTPFTITTTFPPSVITATASFPIVIEPAPGYGIADNITPGTGPLRIDTTRGAAIVSSSSYMRLLDDVSPYMTIRGMQLSSSDPSTKLAGTGSANVTWERNIIRTTLTGGTVDVTLGANSVFRKNVLVLDGTGGDAVTLGAVGGKIQGNTIVRTSDRTAAGTAIDCFTANSDVSGNAIFGFTTPFTGTTPTTAGRNATDQASLGGAAGTGSLTSRSYAASFENTGGSGASSADWRLKAGSTLIDAGAAISGITIDILGTTLPQGTAPDIGAFEVSSGGGGDTTAPTITGAAINGAGTTLTLTASEIVLAGSGGSAGVALTASGGAVTATYSAGSGSTSLTYTLSRTILNTETATVAYTQPGNGWEDAAGNDLATFSGTAVTNNSTQTGGGGTYTDPGIANVKTGVSYTYNGTALTGTYTGADRWTDPGVGNVEAGVAYKANSTTNNRTGTFAVPAIGSVESGVGYGAGGTEFTGTLVVSGGGGGATIGAIQGELNSRGLTAAFTSGAAGLVRADLRQVLGEAATAATPYPTPAAIRAEMDSSSSKLAFLTGNVATASALGAVATTLGDVGTIAVAIANQTDKIPSQPAAVGSPMGAVASVTGPVTVGTNNDKSGYLLGSAGLDQINALPAGPVSGWKWYQVLMFGALRLMRARKVKSTGIVQVYNPAQTAVIYTLAMTDTDTEQTVGIPS